MPPHAAQHCASGTVPRPYRPLSGPCSPWRFLAFSALLLSTAAAHAQAPEPLHQRIDRAIEAAHPGPYAALSTDAEFFRRVTLDLAGYVPSADEARAFLDDPSPYKRAALIDRLLAAPEFSRRMQHAFDVMLMERRPDAAIPSPVWQEYLRKSFAEHKPLNQLAAEILAADGVDPALRPAAKFYLDRGGEVNLLTRDVGRVFFGFDLQCAQCHDHPIVDSYHQEDFYGLSAFLSRGTLFTDGNKTAFFAEKAEGEVSFESVFIADDSMKSTGPHLPGEAPVAEPPQSAPVYLVAPADGVRPVPAYSRRAALARAATGGASLDFNRNLANRLWAMMLGRGLQHPVDYRHLDNPPSHPELLDLLAGELAAMNFDVRDFLRQVALSEAYQRASELPPGVDPASVPADRFAVAELKALTPEQLAWSLMRASGLVDQYRRAALASLQADPRLHDALTIDERSLAQRDEFVELFVYNNLSGNVGPFVSLFAAAPGQPQSEFQTSVHQALFISNGDQIRSWLSPSGDNLLARLTAMSDPRQLMDELFLGTLSRRPSLDEQADVAAYLTGREADRPAALQELAWALVASAEFRFNH